MIITIPIWCNEQKQEHPITLEITKQNTWQIISSTCMEKYGKSFGLMMPCAQYVMSEKNDNFIRYQIAHAAGKAMKNSEDPIAFFEFFYEFFKENENIQYSFISDAMQEISTLQEKSIPLFEQLIQKHDTNIQYCVYRNIESEKEKTKNKIRIPRKLSITSSLIKYIRIENKEKIQQLLNTVIREKITLAIPTIFMHIQHKNPLNEMYIDTILKFLDEKAIRAYLHSENPKVVESAVLILTKLNPPDLLETILPVISKSYYIEEIAIKIIETKATDKHWDILIQAFKTAQYQDTYTAIAKALQKIKPKQHDTTLLQYLKTNPDISIEKQRQAIKTIIHANIQTYKENPTLLLKDLEPKEIHLEYIIICLFLALAKEPETRQRVIKTFIEALKQDTTQKYSPQTIQTLSKIYLKETSQEAEQ